MSSTKSEKQVLAWPCFGCVVQLQNGERVLQELSPKVVSMHNGETSWSIPGEDVEYLVGPDHLRPVPDVPSHEGEVVLVYRTTCERDLYGAERHVERWEEERRERRRNTPNVSVSA